MVEEERLSGGVVDALLPVDPPVSYRLCYMLNGQSHMLHYHLRLILVQDTPGDLTRGEYAPAVFCVEACLQERGEDVTSGLYLPSGDVVVDVVAVGLLGRVIRAEQDTGVLFHTAFQRSKAGSRETYVRIKA